MFKKRNLIFLSLFILGVFLFTSCLPKPPVTEGILKGQVIVPEGSIKAKELTGQALPDATVNIIDLATGDIIATTTTDANGYYQVFVPAGGPYLLEAVKNGVKVQQFTPQVEIGIEYDLGTADCSTTAVALIAQAMMDAEDYPDDLADINLADIEADPDFNEVMSIVCSIIEAGEDPAVSAVVQQAVEDFLNPPAPAPTPTPTPNPTPTPSSSNATISAGTLATVVLAGTFTGGADIASSSALTVTVPDASKTLAALALTKGNENSVVKYVTGAQPADDTAYTGIYSGSTTITVANGDVIWLLVKAEDTTTKLYYKITVTVLAIGDVYGGGKVAYIFQVGDTGCYVPGETHGLIAAPNDQSPGILWYNGTNVITGANATALGTGLANTNTIITVQGVPTPAIIDYAANVARAYNGGGYSDWYLPSKDELNFLFINRVAIGGFAGAGSAYWSSSEVDISRAWAHGFAPLDLSWSCLKDGSDLGEEGGGARVRAVRSF
jgi:hypothetical protein